MSEAIKSFQDHGTKTVTHFKADLHKMRTGRASTSLIENIKVDYYGSLTPLAQMGNLTAPEARMLMVQVYDSSALDSVEKAIRSSELGLNPARDGQIIRINIPALTEDRRKDLIKALHKSAEEFKIQIRNHRRDAVDLVKKAVKDKKIAEDDSKKQQEEIQKHTDKFIAEIDAALVQKEKEMMEV